MQLLIIRHGQSLSNATWEANNGRDMDSDTDLSPLGLAQAAALGAAFKEGRYTKPDVILASLMARSVMTVAPVAEALGKEVRGVSDAHEVGGVYKRVTCGEAPQDGAPTRGPMDQGDADDGTRIVAASGRSREELLTLCPSLLLPADVSDDGWYHHDIETHPQAWERALRVASWLTSEYGDSDPSVCVALVSHGLFSQVLLRALMESAPDLTQPLTHWYYLNNTGLTLTSLPSPWGGPSIVRLFNCTDHLTPDQLSD